MSRCYFLRIRRPGSAELTETSLPCPSRVVVKRPLVRPVMRFCSSRTTAVVSLYPLVTEPMILRFPSRMKSFFSVRSLHVSNTVAREKLAGFGQKSLVTKPDQVAKTFTSTVLLRRGDKD